ncbi:hypothetical protein FACS1894177_04420 [Bacteroidia bacterium]|nr:hypothetical protein FACS1894177_04420 [Bacteroidia bacterium]
MEEKLKKKKFLSRTKDREHLLLSALLFLLPAFMAMGQQPAAPKSVNIQTNNMGVKAALDMVASQTGAYIMYEETVIDRNGTINLSLNNASLSDAIKAICSQANLDYEFKDLHVLIKAKKENPKEKRVLQGIVVDAENETLTGVLVNIAGTNQATQTDENGYYTLEIPKNLHNNAEISFTLLGMKTVTLPLNGNTELNVTMEEDVIAIKDVVITGYFNKDKKSFTGAEVSLKAEDLKNLGASNVLSAMSIYSPSLRLTEQLEFGSDPNHIPEMTLRGQSTFDLRGSAEGSRSNPNSPLFIMDGIEVTAQTVYDYDINQIDNITILKDASATAIYGSRGANGVIVMTTKRPAPGKIKVSLNMNFGISAPDLSDYNLMNAAEKLEYERLAGLYINAAGGFEGQHQLDVLYNERLKEVSRGVDTYWLSQPLQTSFNQRYTLNLEGGDNKFRYMITGRYDDDKGVMKGSGRKKYGIRALFDYNIGENFRIRNDLSVSDLTATNSPFGSFRDYTMQNPYDRIYGEDGRMFNILSYNRINPMVNSVLPNRDLTNTLGWQDNVNLEWRFLDAFRLQGRLSFSKSANKAEAFISPNSPLFEGETDIARKGKASFFNPVETSLDGNIILSYYKTFNGLHTLNVSAGSNLVATSYEGEGFTATGFLNDNLTNIYFAQQYAENSKPRAEQDISRLIGFLGIVTN